MDERIVSISKYNLWDGNTIEIGYERPMYTTNIMRYCGNRVIKVLCGQRRSGKSYIMRQIASELIRQGVSSNNILFINREFTAFDFLVTYKDLDELIQLYEQERSPQGRRYLFIDEVQDIDGWERTINSYAQDYTAEYEIFITGSNSTMLSSELSTLLSGRYVTFNIFPLSYREYSTINSLAIGKQGYMQYMSGGGFPRTHQSAWHRHKTTLYLGTQRYDTAQRHHPATYGKGLQVTRRHLCLHRQQCGQPIVDSQHHLLFQEPWPQDQLRNSGCIYRLHRRGLSRTSCRPLQHQGQGDYFGYLQVLYQRPFVSQLPL